MKKRTVNRIRILVAILALVILAAFAFYFVSAYQKCEKDLWNMDKGYELALKRIKDLPYNPTTEQLTAVRETVVAQKEEINRTFMRKVIAYGIGAALTIIITAFIVWFLGYFQNKDEPIPRQETSSREE